VVRKLVDPPGPSKNVSDCEPLRYQGRVTVKAVHRLRGTFTQKPAAS
jgi:hypothetical protein